MRTIKLATNYYQQFDADLRRNVPAEGYGGWKKATLELVPAHSAVVVMHAWDAGSLEQYPGWHRAVEYIPRSYDIVRNVFPGLLKAVRASDLKLYHVVGGGDYYKHSPGYIAAKKLAAKPPKPLPTVDGDPVMWSLSQFRADHVFVGRHNVKDVVEGFKHLELPAQARPIGNEGVAENADQLFALCKCDRVNHLIYCGFAINWCLLLSPGGMADMSKRGVMCSALRQATTAVENRETARNELCKQLALWRVALAFGFVYDVNDFIKAIRRK